MEMGEVCGENRSFQTRRVLMFDYFLSNSRLWKFFPFLPHLDSIVL
jgi:hypothetical protein